MSKVFYSFPYTESATPQIITFRKVQERNDVWFIDNGDIVETVADRMMREG